MGADNHAGAQQPFGIGDADFDEIRPGRFVGGQRHKFNFTWKFKQIPLAALEFDVDILPGFEIQNIFFRDRQFHRHAVNVHDFHDGLPDVDILPFIHEQAV